jgi:hypothetical protein
MTLDLENGCRFSQKGKVEMGVQQRSLPLDMLIKWSMTRERELYTCMAEIWALASVGWSAIVEVVVGWTERVLKRVPNQEMGVNGKVAKRGV